MVNRIPAYLISAGGKFAILASRAHPHGVRSMAEACKLALRSPSSIVVLAALEDTSRFEQPIATALASTDFDAPVVPGLVPRGAGEASLAAAGQESARAAVELTNLATLFEG